MVPLAPSLAQSIGRNAGSGPSLPTVQPSAPFVDPPGQFTPPPVTPLTPGTPSAPSLGSSVTFDTNIAELKWQDNRWGLWAGNVYLKDFGRYETEGREVLRLVRELRLNALATIGTPRPIMEYWLSNNEAPRGPIAGLRTLPIDQASLRAEQVQGQWVVRDGQRILFNFGSQGDAARQAAGAIQQYGFTQVGYVGQVSPVMLVFLAPPTAVPAAATMPGAAPTARTTVDANRSRGMRFPNLASLLSTSKDAPAATPTMPPPSSPVSSAALPSLPPGQQPSPLPVTPLSPTNGIVPVNMTTPAASTAPGAPLLGWGGGQPDRVPFDARRLEVRRDKGDWKVAAGAHVLANFGPSEADARLAQAALRYYHCTEMVTVGRPQPVMSFFLANGQAPRGQMLGLHGTSFRPDSLSLRQLGPSVVLWDGQQVVLSFGDRGAEAQQALQAIQQHRFDRLVRIGQGDHSMTLLVRAN